MAVHIDGIFDKEINAKINASKILIVGAGGIGCELLKNLVTTGFENLDVIDLDTIDLSNLNRQFLFHKQHIGKPKAIVARETVLKFNPKAQITAHHDTITNPNYDVEFFSQFSAVANALDNVAARSHVNRMCLAADIPLIESGTAGYFGQVTVYKKGISECFECLPRPREKTYPGCTIRNTPSEPVHCIVWAKNLFNQLFGESDADEEVSPDVADPSLTTRPEENSGNVVRVSTREWAKSAKYDPLQIFNKIFNKDIDYLNTMNDLWRSRKRPQSLVYDFLLDSTPGPSRREDARIKDQRLWSMKQCGEIFCKSLTSLKNKLEAGGTNDILIWDKDDEECLDFVASCANLRSYCFGIPQKTRFDIKAIAGNIIPAIATTNAVIAGLIVLQIIKVLKGDFTKCKNAWLKASGNGGKILPSSQLEKPNPKCMVCSSTTPEVKIMLDVNTLTIRTLSEKVLKEKLHMAQPDAMLNDGSGRIVISSDPEDFGDEMMEKTLSDFGMLASTKILCEDFLQHYKIQLIIVANPAVKDQDFIIETDVDKLIEQQKIEAKPEEQLAGPAAEADVVTNNIETVDEDDVEIFDAESETDTLARLIDSKRKLSDDENSHELQVEKKRKTLRL